MINFYKIEKALKVKFNIFRIAFVLFVLVLADQPSHTLAEGVEQFKPDTTKSTALMILNTHVTYGTFASYSATDTNRLFICINNPTTEKIYFGIGGRSTNSNWYFRIKNPNGVVISGPTLLPTAAGQQGFIEYYKQAIAGPNVLSPQGYNGFVITPTTGLAGNYYIEFNSGSPTVETFNTEINFEIFDVAVVNTTTNTEVQGRLFSYNWSFNISSYANPFFGSFYIYGADSSVTKVDMNGIKPYKFRVSCNSWGTSNSGIVTIDRRSKVGFSVSPQLRLFLQDPDQTVFPNGSMQFFSGPVRFTRSVKDSVCININLTRFSDVTIFIDRNGNGVYNPGTADIKLFYPQAPAGPNCLFWNAKDGLGNYVSPGNVLSVTISIQNGQVDLPMFDIENNETGYTMSVIRPGAGIFVDSLFYDDQLVGGSTNLVGCAFPCHSWASNPANSESNSIGNGNTINSWWFAHTSSSVMSITMPDTSVQVGCDPSVPTFNVDLTGQPGGSFTTPDVVRSGNCCGTTSPDRCIHFVITLDSDAVALSFNITDGAIPPGALFYQVDCGPQTQVGNYICISGVGPHHLTFCKPGNNTNQYTVTSIPAPIFPYDDSVRVGCSRNFTVTGLKAPTTTWKSIYPGAIGAYNSLLSCSTGCTTTTYTPLATSPPYIDYVICGEPIASNCLSVLQFCDTVRVFNFPDLTANITPNPATFCPGSPGALLNVVPGGGLPPYTYTWKNSGGTTVGTSSTYLASTAGTYIVEITDALYPDCPKLTATVPVSVSNVLLSTISTNASCFTGNDGTASSLVSGGTIPYTYNWSNGATTQNVNGLTAGNYTVTVRDAGGCTKTSLVTITQPSAALSGNVNAINNISCYNGNNGSLNLVVSGGTPPYSYQWNTGATTQNLINISSGTYSVTVTDSKACTSFTGSITVAQPAAALSAGASSVSDVSCFAGNNGSINLTISGGTSPYSIIWSNWATTQNISGLSAGNYSATVTDANGCTNAVSAITISQPVAALSIAGTSITNVNCFGDLTGDINITMSGGTAPYTYQWSTGENTQDLNNVPAGTYTITITDANSCNVQSSSITISQPSAPLSGTTTTTSNVSCNSGANGAISLSVNGGTPSYTFLWNNGATTQNISGLYAGNYVVTITDNKGCSENVTGSITQPAGSLNSSVSVSQDVSCFGGNNGAINVTATGGTLPYSYLWSTGTTTQNISGLTSGGYTVTIHDANGCINVSSAVINQPSAGLSTAISAQSNVSCFGGNNGLVDLTVNGGTMPYAYTWSNGSPEEDQFNLAAGNYTVTVTDANGCTVANSAITVSQPAAALNSSVSSSTNVSCNGGNNGSINLTVSGGTMPYSYNWSNGANSEDISGLVASAYTVTVTDVNGCTMIVSGVTISQPPAALIPSVDAVSNVSCFGGNTGIISLNVMGGTAPYSYIWSNGSTTQNLSNVPASSYAVTVTDSHGCTDMISAITVSQPAASLSSSVSATGNVSCNGGNDGSIDLNVSGGTAPYSFSWSNGINSQDLNNVPSGIYTVTITDAHGCTTLNSGITISQPAAALNGSASSSSDVNCFGGSNGSVNLSVNGGTAPYSYNWSNGATTQDISNLQAGYYTVTITDIKGCTTSVQGVMISQPSAALAGSISSSIDVNCFGGNNGSINLTVNGGTGPYSYAWSNGAGTQDLNNITSGTYNVTVTDANGCTTVVSGIVISQPAAALNGNVVIFSNVSCFGGHNGSLTLSVNGGTAPYSYNWSNSSTNPNVSNVSAGTYTVTITDANGCSYSVDGTITQPAFSISATANVTQNVSCNAGTNGSIDLTVNGGTPPFTYDWNNAATTQDISNLSAGNYSVSITDANGCTYSESASVNQPSGALSASSTVTGNISCFSGNNGSIDLTVNGGTSPYSYNWNTGAATQDLSSLSAGTYSVTVTDANGCTTNNTAVISQPAGALSSSITVSSNVLCNGGNAGTIDLSVSGGTPPYNYNWSNGSTIEDLTNLVAGSYTATITDANGCFSTVTGTITQPSSALSANAFVSQNVSCYSGANGSVLLTVSGGTTPYAYNWSNGATTQNINNLSSGTYTVNITDANGCTQTATGTVIQPSGSLSSFASITQNVSCYAGANGSIDLTVSGGTSPYIFSWSNGANTEDISGLISGTYIVNITDANGCTSSQSGIITQPSGSLSATASVSQNVSCYAGANGAINLTVNGGTSPYSFNWSNGASTEDISNLLSGIYTVSVTDANGCTSTQSGTITQPTGALNATANVIQNVSCNSGANGAINLSVNGGTMPYSYNWSNGETTQNINNLTTGTYTVTITDANGCTTIQSNTVSQPSGALSATAAASQNVSCFGGTNGAITITVTGGTTPYSYNWSNGLTTQNLSNLSSGNYTVTITDANGCTVNQAEVITQPSASLSASSSADQNVSCFGGSNGLVILNVNGGTAPYSYNWSNGASTQNLINVSAGTYTVTVTDANGCTANQTQNISEPSASLSASSSANQNVSCFGGTNGSLVLIVNGGTTPYSYNWSNGATIQNIANLTSGTYTVTVIDANGCSANQTQTITEPSASLSALSTVNNQVSCFGGANGSINLAVSGGTAPYSYNWSNGVNTQDINGLSTGIYTVTVTDANGCTTISTASVTQPSGALAASVSTSQNVSCNSGSNGSMTVSVSGGTSPYTYDWSNGESTQNITNLSSGTYTVTITDANGCITTQDGTISQPSAALSATSSANQNVSCYGGVNGAITLNVSGGTVPYSFNWSNGATTQNIGSLTAGTYTVSITDANGCTANQSQVVTQPSAGLSATANTSQNVSCFGGSNAAINVTVNGGTAPYTFDWSNGANTQNLSSIPSGTYTITVTDANACTDVQTVTITQPSAGLSAISTVTGNISCFSGNNGSIDLTVSGGTAPYIYNWNTGATTEDLSGLSAGSYSVTITDANGCITTDNAVITQPAGSLSASISLTQGVLCNGGNNGSINLTVGGGTNPYTYNWSNGATTQDISNLSAGTYTATITDANGCNASVTGIISQPSVSLSATTSVTQNVSCYSGSNGTIDLTVNGGTAPYSFIWSNGATTEDISNLSVGTFTVSITDANGCTSSQSGTVTQPSGALSATASTTQNVSCYSGSNGTIDLTVNGGTTPYSFAWSNGATTEDISNLSVGTYIVSITDANGCTSSQSGTVTQPTGVLSATASTTQNVSCYSGANGTIDLTVNGGTSPYIFNWSNGTTTEDLNNLSAGTYTVSITDANGCTFIETGSISQPSGALSASTTVTGNISCFSGNNGSIDLTVSGGTLPYTYVWNTGATTEDIINLSAGTYSVSITDANGCTSNSTATITQPAGALSTNIAINQQVSCYAGSNGTIDLTITGGTLPYIYSWSNGATTEDISNLSAGTYTVTINDVNGCNASATGIITQPTAALNASANVTQNVSCYSGTNGSIDLTATDGTAPYTFNWSTGETTEDISNLSSGTYTVTVTDVNGCTAVTTATITQPSGALSATLNGTQPISCFAGANGSIDLNVINGTPPYSYNWSNGATTEDISNLASGTYSVTITDAQGCTTSLSATISQPTAALNANISVTQNVSCFAGTNATIDLTAANGTAPYTFNWSNGATTEDISNLSSGTYTVTVTDANGCTQTASGTITQPSASLSASAGVSQNVSCYSDANGSINLTVNGGTSPFTFNWSNGATTQNISGLSSGIYSVTITDANGCTTNTSASVTQPSASINASANVTQNVNCNSGTNGAINLTVTGGTLPFTFTWSNSATTEDLSNLSAGTYTVSVTDANGCTQTASATVAQPANSLSANATVSQNVSCFGAGNGSVHLAITGGTSPYSYNWSNGSTTQNLINLPQGTFTVIVTDANGCTQSASATVTQPSSSMSVNGSGGATNCLGGVTAGVSINVNGGTSPFSYSWNTGATTQNISNQLAGTYTVTVTDANGCTNNGSFVITDQSAFNANASGPSDICMGELAMLIADSITGATYQWYANGQILTGSNTNIYLTPASGSYIVTVSNSCGTFTSDSMVIKVHTVDNISVSPNVIICPGESTQLDANGGVSYEWTPADGLSYSNIPNPVASPSVTTHYTVTITDDFGCKATGDVQVGVECDSLVIPSGFSPNGDVINDAFVIKGLENYPGNKIWIYNRWGNLIYKTTDYANKWDGFSNVSGIYIGKKVPSGTYFYVLDLNNNRKPLQGYVVLKY